jgi:3-hydroxyisobutyrate dehydrogenase-like beta-hydroxyacid dehydrogenase
MKIAFIGLGIMGSRMAANLLKHSVEVCVYNRSEAPVKRLQEMGARAASSAGEAVQEADLVFSMLSTPEVVRAVFLSENGALYAMKKQAIWVDCSTVNPSFSRAAHAAAEQAGIRFMDIPVAGTKPHAEQGELVFFAGAPEPLLNEVKPYLDMMGKKVLHIGETGQGSAFKMLVNIMLAQSMLIFSEAVLLGEKMGISRSFLLKVVPNLVVSAPFTAAKAEMIKKDDYEVQFPLEWMQKDLHLAAISAYELNQPLYLANLAKELFAEATKKGMGRMDFAAIHKFLEER